MDKIVKDKQGIKYSPLAYCFVYILNLFHDCNFRKEDRYSQFAA